MCCSLEKAVRMSSDNILANNTNEFSARWLIELWWVGVPLKYRWKLINHRDPTLMTMLYLLQQLLKKRIDLSIRQEGAKIEIAK